MTSRFTGLMIGLMQALQIPISISPFWYRNVRPDRSFYRPFFQPWRKDQIFAPVWKEVKNDATVLDETAYTLFALARMATMRSGEIWECGVYKGATARLLATARDCHPPADPPRVLRLFDTFSGVPERRTAVDGYAIGSLGDTSIDMVRARLGRHAGVHLHPGLIPASFLGLECSQVSFAHIDVVQYETTKQCCEFIFPRLIDGGIMVIDDYGRPRTFGCRVAVDEFFGGLGIAPIVLNTGQALIVK